jgi:hypothetical protein
MCCVAREEILSGILYGRPAEIREQRSEIKTHRQRKVSWVETILVAFVVKTDDSISAQVHAN